MNISEQSETHQDRTRAKRMLPFEHSSSHMEAPVSFVSSSRCLNQAQEAQTNC